MNTSFEIHTSFKLEGMTSTYDGEFFTVRIPFTSVVDNSDEQKGYCTVLRKKVSLNEDFLRRWDDIIWDMEFEIEKHLPCINWDRIHDDGRRGYHILFECLVHTEGFEQLNREVERKKKELGVVGIYDA